VANAPAQELDLHTLGRGALHPAENSAVRSAIVLR
jgi:hypothetical protein